MAKVKTIRIFKRDDKTDTVLIDINVDIKVSSKGLFSATFPKEVDEELFRIKGRDYEITGKTLEEVENAVYDATSLLYSKEVIEDKFVIIYDINTFCYYSKDSDKYISNIEYKEFISGTDTENHSKPYSFSIYCTIRRKVTVRYSTGVEKYYLEKPDRTQLGENGIWISDLFKLCLPLWKHESECSQIDYTEENAMFFRKFVSMIFMVNDFVKANNEPGLLQEHINNTLKIDLF